MAAFEIQEYDIALNSGFTTRLTLHDSTVNDNSGKTTIIIYAHGLGSRNPALTHQNNDKWRSIFLKSLDCKKCSCISYTARGHGDTCGWQDSAKNDLMQFCWDRLAMDMISLADYQKCRKYFAAGSSMGAATALFTAMLDHSGRLQGAILMRPPTAWESRSARREAITKAADDLLACNPNELHHYVLRGACMADLPSPSTDIEMYNQISCPVLILAYYGDDAHPVSTATILSNIIRSSTLHISEDARAAEKEWPKIISEFINNIISLS
eukprot:gene8909-18438_t